MVDSYRHKGMRKRMVEALRAKGLTSDMVIQAMLEVPRHFFVDNVFVEHAYDDKAFPIAAGQTISHPSTVAMQSQLLDVKPGMKVLEIGTGSGYQAAVLIKMGVRLYSIERQKELYTRTKPLLKKMNYHCECYYGDGYKGKTAFAPFDRIIITCGAPFIPEDLVQQLSIGGRMVIPVGADDTREMFSLDKTESGLKKLTHGAYKFVPMLEQKGSDI
ncbi:MAG: protein-L-isoaspartate(D-aspartate) O-methyltransferase [Bacteroidetes bacterium]|nr:protein-L-isoaspartate(D-aspartate) O-methyltransferase [Bacteroidota bacterium]